jgi:hypothetical protein
MEDEHYEDYKVEDADAFYLPIEGSDGQVVRARSCKASECNSSLTPVGKILAMEEAILLLTIVDWMLYTQRCLCT